MVDIAVTDFLLNEVTSQLFTDYNFFGTGTSSAATTVDLTDLVSPVQIGAGTLNRNKIRESGTTESFIGSGSQTFVNLFKLNSLEPNVLPVNLREFGSHKTEADNNDMGSRKVLTVDQTKDNTVTWNIRYQMRVNRVN